MYRVARVVAFSGIKRHPMEISMVTRMAVRANTGQSLSFVSMQGQRRKRLTVEPATGCDAGPALNRYWVHRIEAYTDLSAVVVVEGIGLHVEDILVSLVLSIIISWTFRILAHEENQYSYVYKILG